jgi:hypothetical protein
MNGLYRVPLNPEEKPEDNPRVKALLRAIDPGAEVTITRIEGKLKLAGGFADLPRDGRMWGGCIAEHYCEIRATGGTARKHVPHMAKNTPPALVTAKRIAKECGAARLLAVRPGLIPEPVPAWRFTRADREVLERHPNRRKGRAIARAIAQGRDTVALNSGVFGVRKLIEDAAAHRWHEDETVLQPFGVGLPERLEAYRDYLYWRELEALSGRREKFKPGRTDETAREDEGIEVEAPAVAGPVAVAPVAEPKKRRGWFVQNCLGRSVWVELAA